MTSVIRVIADFDRSRSNYITYPERHPEAPDAQSNDEVVQLNDIYMPEDLSEDWHAFFIYRSTVYFIFDEVIVDAWRQNKFNSWFFTPLQPPLKREYTPTQYWYFDNRPYWAEKDGK